MQPQELEREAWVAMAVREGPAFFGHHMADDGAMVLPGAVLRKDEAVLAACVQEPWEEFRLDEEQVFDLRPGVQVLIYRARAKRAAEPWYEGRVTSVYVADDAGRWWLKLHQQTPVAG